MPWVELSYRVYIPFHRLDALTYIPTRFATFLMGVAEVAGSDAGGFDPEKVADQLRVGFQASQVRKRKDRRHTEADTPTKKGRKRRRTSDIFSSSDENLRDADVSAFHSTLVPFDSDDEMAVE